MRTIKKLFVAALMLLPLSAMSQTTLSIGSFNINGGETKDISISLNNPDDEITLVQFDLRLPSGLSLKQTSGEYDIDIAGRTNWRNHSLNANATDGIIRFLLASQSNAVISGTSGAIIKMTLTASSSFNGGVIRLENILLVTPNEKEIKPADVVFEVKGTSPSEKLTLSANPSGGSVDSGTKVYLTASANGSTVSGANIYYTLNGSTPSTSSKKYTSSGISITADCTLKAIAYKEGYETSDVLTASYTVTPSGIAINATNFPDESFRNYLLDQDYGKDGILTEEEIKEVTYIYVSRYADSKGNIKSLKGIEYFTALTGLSCYNNQLTSLDVSKNTALTSLYCYDNQLTSLDVSKNTALTELVCYHNNIKGSAMDALVNSLNSLDAPEKVFLVIAHEGEDGNVCTKSQVAIAKGKGWNVLDSYLAAYEGSEDISVILVSDIAIKPFMVSLLKDDTIQLTVDISPSNADNKDVTWTSDMTNIASVSSNGLVKAKAAGSATVTCKANDGSGKSKTLQVFVSEKRSGSIIVGMEDNSSSFYRAMSPTIKLLRNQTLHYEFINYSNRANKWNNWLLCVFDENSEFFWLRADEFGWGSVKTFNIDNCTLTKNGSMMSDNWGAFVNDMDGAHVIMDIIRKDDNLTIKADMIGAISGDIYQETYTCDDIYEEEVCFCLSVDECHLVINNTSVFETGKQDREIKLSSTGYATFYDSQSAYTLPNGLSAQVVTGASNSKLTYKTIADGSVAGVVPKGTAVMLVSDNKRSGTYTLTSSTSTTTYSGTNLLRGSDEATTTSGNDYHYKLSYGRSGSSLSNVFGWYWGAQNGGSFQIEGHKAWLVVPQTAATRGYAVEGETLGIEEIDGSQPEDDIWYDLQGRRIEKPASKGLYIKNGKKITIK